MPFKSKTSETSTETLQAYCLVCVTYLKSETEIFAHVEEPVHMKNLETTPYHDKYKDDCIRKVTVGYYCEYCNTLFPSSAHVTTHVTEAKHIDNRKIQTLRKVENDAEPKNVFISEDAWIGIIEKTCTICHVDLQEIHSSVGEHKLQHFHKFNLIKSKMEFSGEALYRKCADAFQCLATSETFSSEDKMNHVENSDYRTKYSECCGNSIAKVQQASVNEAKNDEKKAEDNINKAGPSNFVKTELSNDNTKHSAKLKPEKNYVEIEKDMCKLMGAKNYIIDDVRPQTARCILCHHTMIREAVAFHLNHRHHIEVLKMHKARLQKMSTETDIDLPASGAKDATDAEENDNKAKILDSIEHFQKNEINIDVDNSAAVCKKCLSTLKFDFDSIVTHIEEHKEAPNVSKTAATSGLIRKPSKPSTKAANKKSFFTEEMQTYMREHDLQVREDKVHCSLCDVPLPDSLKNWTQHVNGLQHKIRVQHSRQLVPNINAPRKVSVRNFIEVVMFIGNNSQDYVLFNDNFCLTHSSFMMVSTVNHPTMFCYLCLENYDINELRRHFYSHEHRSTFFHVKVVTSLKNEFVREVQEEVYHCGYCNTTQSGWDALEDHLRDSVHSARKNEGLQRLRIYQDKLQAYEKLRFNEAMAELVKNLIQSCQMLPFR